MSAVTKPALTRCSQKIEMEGVYWAVVVATAAEARRQPQAKGRPPVLQWRGATTAGGVPKEGLPAVLRLLGAGLHLGLLRSLI